MSLILVVDDESDVEMLFRQQFRRELRAGLFRMDFALSADSALQRMSDVAAASLILILSDINMPGMTGLELLPKAKATRPDVPVIMITAYGDADTERKALAGGADALLTKPIDFDALRNRIDSRLAIVNCHSMGRCPLGVKSAVLTVGRLSRIPMTRNRRVTTAP